MTKQFPIKNSLLAAKAMEAARAQNPRKKNWVKSIPQIGEVRLGGYDSQDVRRGQYTCQDYYPVYSSFLEISYVDSENAQDRQLVYHYGFAGQMKSVNVRKPKNWEWRWDKSGVYLMPPDGCEWHISCEEILTKGFVKNVKTKIKAKRIQVRKQEILNAELRRNDLLFHNSLANTFVNFYDSKRAGNCIEGSLNFAERILDIPREMILAAPWLLQVSAQRLIGQGTLAENAVKQAYLRETMVCL